MGVLPICLSHKKKKDGYSENHPIIFVQYKLWSNPQSGGGDGGGWRGLVLEICGVGGGLGFCKGADTGELKGDYGDWHQRGALQSLMITIHSLPANQRCLSLDFAHLITGKLTTILG